MALLYDATINPTKIEILEAWVPQQGWLGDADAASLHPVGAFRFDDPDGEVGLETHLLETTDGQILQAPVTYRGSPVPGFESFLIATTQHSVLGTRWVYDACGDPVYVKALATAVLNGGTQADIDIVIDGVQKRVQAKTLVSGSGSAETVVPEVTSVSYSHEGSTTVIRASHLEVTLIRSIGSDHESADRGELQRLVGTWPRHETPALLAFARIT